MIFLTADHSIDLHYLSANHDLVRISTARLLHLSVSSGELDESWMRARGAKRRTTSSDESMPHPSPSPFRSSFWEFRYQHPGTCWSEIPFVTWHRHPSIQQRLQPRGATDPRNQGAPCDERHTSVCFLCLAAQAGPVARTF